MPDGGAPHRSRLGKLGECYWSSARRAIRVVKGVPGDWPPPVRLLVQGLLAIAVALLVLATWILMAVLLVLRVVGGAASRGGSPSGPPRGPEGYA